MTSTMRRALLPATFVLAALAATLASVGPASAGTRSAGAAVTDQATVMTRSGPMGTYLTDGQGRSLYLFVANTVAPPTCSVRVPSRGHRSSRPAHRRPVPASTRPSWARHPVRAAPPRSHTTGIRCTCGCWTRRPATRPDRV